MKRVFSALLLALLALAVLPSLVRADGFIIVTDGSVLPPRPGHPVYAPLEVSRHQVKVEIEGQVATTSVDQEFYNPASRVVEGTYFFPVPRDAQIAKFQLEIDGKWTDPELLDAAKARAIYEDIVRRQKDPALLEYANNRLYKARIFPIEPRSHKRVRISYREVLPQDFGALAYRYPLNTEKFSAAPLKNLSIEVEAKLDRAYGSVYSPSHAVKVTSEAGGKRFRASFEASNLRPDTDFELLFAAPVKGTGEAPLSLLAYRDPLGAADDDGYFVLFAAPPVGAGGKAQPAPKDVVFVLDTSGSMNGPKIEQARKALSFCVNNLNAGDRFDLIRFSSENEALFGKLEENSADSRKRALSFIDGLKAMGGTAIHDALQRALEMKGDSARPFVVIFLTDGLANIGPSKNDEILGMLRKRSGAGTRVFSFGIGHDVNTHLLDQIAEQTRAASTYVLPTEDLEVKLSNFFAKITEPVLTELKLDVTGGDGVRFTSLHPQTLPDLFAGDQLVLTGRFRGKGEAQVTLRGKRAGQEQEVALKVSFDAPRERDASREFIPRLWATRRVAFLLDEIRLRGDHKELREEVTVLARKFGLVTPYTAYLILEDEARRDVPPERRALSQLGKDAAARRVAESTFKELREEQTGANAVAGARGQALARSADRASDALIAQNSTVYGAKAAAPMAAPVVEAVKRAESYTANASRFVNGRAFYQNGSQWIDATIAARGKSETKNPPQRIAAGSDEYFALLRKHPEAGQWLALGNSLLIHLGGVDYEIH
ncbi:MAG: VWA domain-containing protein [Verrucomicrobia bacterium]|nr:VWA domain-containing protein [Verrucomicrobiota bacterium]